jgi:hypothetical protein
MATGYRQLEKSSQMGHGARAWLRAIGWAFVVLSLGSVAVAMLVYPVRGEVRQLLGIQIAPATAPGSASMAACIAANNVREAAIPFLCLALRPRRWPWLLRAGDVVVWSCLAVNVALGGLALGAYGPRLLAYLPQWPFEWAGLAVALAVWTRARRGRRDYCELFLLGIVAALLLSCGALVETFATPQV